MSNIQDTIPLGCMGNKRTELKLLLPIIEPQITTATIFVEPFCGSSIVSFNVFKQINKNIDFHINDLDPLRIKFHKNMTKEKERQKLYKLEKEIVEKGEEFYYSIVRGKDDDYYDNFNVINVECDYTSKKCTHSVGGLLDSKGSSEFQPYLNVRTETFQIVNWNKEFLIYKDIGSCYEVTFTLMRETETLTGIRKYSKKNPRCQRDDEIKYSIIDGFEYYRSESKKVQNVFLNILVSLLVFGISVYGIYRTLKPKKINE